MKNNYSPHEKEESSGLTNKQEWILALTPLCVSFLSLALHEVFHWRILCLISGLSFVLFLLIGFVLAAPSMLGD